MLCPNCGYTNRPIAKICSRCGKRLPTVAIQGLLKNRYRILHEAGRGGMGAVYLAEDTGLFGKHLIVKEMLLPADPAERSEAEDNFRREAELLAKLNHAKIPEIHDYFVEQGKYFLIMELAEGENLEKRLERNRNPLLEREVVNYAVQVSQVLEYLAQQNPPVIHRDIKPANIIVDQKGLIHLVDFGIARAKPIGGTTVGKDTSAYGTPGYAPPEQYAGHTESRSDIHALGATMHHLLTGIDPRNASQRQFVPINSVRPDISLAVSQLIEQMLDADVTRRPKSAQLTAKLQAIGNIQPLVFSQTQVAYTIQDLVNLCDQNRSRAIQFLKDRHIENWLTEIGRPDLAVEAKQRRIFLNTHRSNNGLAVLEEILHLLSPSLPTPTISISPTQLNLTVNRGAPTQINVTVQSNGRVIEGTISSTPSAFFTMPAQFVCHPPSFSSTLTLTFNPYGVGYGMQRGTVMFDSPNAATATLAISYSIATVPKPPVSIAPAPKPIASPMSPPINPGTPMPPANPAIHSPLSKRRVFPMALYRNLMMLASLLACLMVLLGIGSQNNPVLVMYLGCIGFVAGIIIATMIALMVYYSR